MAGKTIEAAGGIVVRKGAGKLIAVVQRAKDDAWVLPRGKLKRDENPAAAARREVVEETGHRVEVHEYLGAITYRAGRRPKVVQFWRMEADAEASHELMPDIVAVDWLPIKAAIRRLSYPLEKLFLRHAIARALKKRPATSVKAQSGAGKAKPGKVKAVKAKLPKTKSSTAKPKLKKAPKKSANKAAARLSDKLKRKDKKSDKRKAQERRKERGKNRSKRKDKNNDKKNKAERKEGKKKKPKADAAPAPANAIAVAPAAPALQPHTGERSGERHKTILQRVLGRLSG